MFPIFDDQLFDFEYYSERIFEFQKQNNTVFKDYLSWFNSGNAITYLPIRFFKSHTIVSNNNPAQITFTSSGTTGATTSKHYVTDVTVYEESFLKAFQLFYGEPSEYAILALLPNYLERKGSSLVYMAEKLIQLSKNKFSNFYLYNQEDLYKALLELKANNVKTMLIGVSFALWDFVENFSIEFPDLIVMETGGMKGKREEITRNALHAILKQGFGLKAIHSEYGMTELLSQAYSKGEGIFFCPPWLKIEIRSLTNPAEILPIGKTGGINIIDLANYNSCSFIETEDIGKLNSDGSFEVLGRMDNSIARGCNLLI